jgi:hypothetical protein
VRSDADDELADDRDDYGGLPWHPDRTTTCRRGTRDGHWRVFYTQQHGDNPTYEIVPSP